MDEGEGQTVLAAAHVSDFHDDANRNFHDRGRIVTPGTKLKRAFLKCRGKEARVKAVALAAEPASGTEVSGQVYLLQRWLSFNEGYSKIRTYANAYNSSCNEKQSV